MPNPLKSWYGATRGSALGTRIFIHLISIFGLTPGYLLLRFVVLYYMLTDKRSRTALTDFRAKLGLKTTLFSLYPHYYAFGEYLLDRYAFFAIKKPFFLWHTHNEEFIEQEANKNKGVILAGAHIGNWEIAGNLLSDRLSKPVYVCMLPNEKTSLTEVGKQALADRKINIIEITPGKPDATIAIVNALRNGGIVALLCDRAIDDNVECIDFLGAPAAFPKGPFLLSCVTGSPIIPVFVEKTSSRTYSFTAWGPLHMSAKKPERNETIRSAMLSYVKILESVVKKNPRQWFNFYDFWQS